MKTVRNILLLLTILFILGGCTTNDKKSFNTSEIPSPAVANLSAPSLMLHVNGNKVFNEKGQEIRLIGVNICSLEWNSRGDNVIKSVYEVFANWNCNVVRLPLSQDYWFGKITNWSTPRPPDNGVQYQKTVDDIIQLASEFGKYIILDLHWSNGGIWGQYNGQCQMPDENSLEFWVDVAKKYKNHPAVLFNLYNEPHGITWEVWRNGGDITEIVNKGKSDEKTLTYTTPGHQKILEAIRAEGANNIIVAGGLDWAYDLSGIVNYALEDTPNGNGVIYDSHIYPWKEWDGTNHNFKVLRIHSDYPIIIGEIGIDPDGEWGASSRPNWLKGMLDWMDVFELHWVGWCFHTDATPNMISNWQYTPTKHHGAILKQRLLSYYNTNAHLDKLPKKP